MNKEDHIPFWRQIIKFNLPVYFIAVALFISGLLILLFCLISILLKIILIVFLVGTLWFVVGSVAASFFIYDLSDLYKFNWLKRETSANTILLNVYSGYSEAGILLNKRFPDNFVHHLNFFNDNVSVSRSIRVAQRISGYLSHDNIDFSNWPDEFKGQTILFMQSLHELRSMDQKVLCLREAIRHLFPRGRIIVVEHLCDLRNFLIYGPGAFHFFSKQHWMKVFKKSKCRIIHDFSVTPFVKVYILSNGTS